MRYGDERGRKAQISAGNTTEKTNNKANVCLVLVKAL